MSVYANEQMRTNTLLRQTNNCGLVSDNRKTSKTMSSINETTTRHNVSSPQKRPAMNKPPRRADASCWSIKASDGALNTSNPIREIIETMNLAENPNKKVIPLSIGDPTIFGNLKPCKEILDALNQANLCGKYYGYQTAAGMESAREAVAEYHYKCTGNRVRLQDVILASGCSHAIDLCICVLARRGQNILIPRPGFPLYKTLTSVYGVRFKQYDLLADKNWSIDLTHLESLIDDNTAAIVINNPSNPCGSVFGKRHLIRILDLAEQYKLPIIADEIYDKFVFSPEFYRAPPTSTKNIPTTNNQHQQPPLSTTTTTTLLVAPHQDKFPIGCNRLDSSNLNAIKSKNLSPVATNCNGANNNIDIKICQTPNQQRASGRLGASGQASGLSSPSSGIVSSDIENETQNTDSDTNASDVDEYQKVDDQIDEDTDNVDEYLDEDDDDDQENDSTFLQYVPFRSLASLSKTVPILTCGGISKTCLIPGLRLGWIIINDKNNIFDQSIRSGLSRLTQRLMGPNSLVQGALHDILKNVPEHFYKRTMDFIFKNAKLCYERLVLVKGLRPYMPQGSMYLMVRFDPDVFPKIEGDLDFTSKLMNEESVLVLPGKCFDFPNFFRICLTVPTNVMEEALNRIEEFCERHAFVDIENDASVTKNITKNFSDASIQIGANEDMRDQKSHILSPSKLINNKKHLDLTLSSNTGGQLNRSNCK